MLNLLILTRIVVLRLDIDYIEAVNMLDACASVNVTCMCLYCCFFQANCSVTIHAFEETGIATDAIYRLALVAEDFPHGLITVGNESFTRRRALSKVPLQVRSFGLFQLTVLLMFCVSLYLFEQFSSK